MMTSTYPNKNGLREIESKKEALNALETALKKRVSEFKELCLKEGELTGHLPIDYPLQPREPIPQIRRRIKHNSDSSINNKTNLTSENFNNAHPVSIKSREHRLPSIQPQAAFAINSNANMPFPSRPTSTNSTSSSISTASSNTRNGNNIHHTLNNRNNNGHHHFNPSIASSSSIQSSSLNNGFSNLYNDQCNKLLRNHQPVRYDNSLLPNHFKRPFNLPATSSFDSDALGQMRASSTASSSSSSGSGASSTLSAPTVPNLKTSASLNSMTNLHARSYSENIATNPATFHSSNISNSRNRHHNHNQTGQQRTFNLPMNTTNHPSCPPPRPPRGLNFNQAHQVLSANSKATDQNHLKTPSENSKDIKPVDALQTKSTQRFNIDGVANFQPYYEETKPFQMSDFYKYSSKHRQKVNDDSTTKFKTTRQLQEEVSKKYSLKLPSCDDQIQASVKLIEKSGQKLIEATAKAIAGNPGLAEKINNILPNSGDRY